jgi:hypothetical protein
MKREFVLELEKILMFSYRLSDAVRLVLEVKGGTFRRDETLRDLLFSCNLSQLQEIFDRTKVSSQFDRYA